MTLSKLTAVNTGFTTNEQRIRVYSGDLNPVIDAVNALQVEEDADIALKANIASPVFTGVVTIPTPFTLGSTSVTTTGAKLNYLKDATGTTGTATTNVVFSASPTLTGLVDLPDITMTGHKNAQMMLANAFNCPAPGTGWTPSALGATLPASQAGAKMWIPLNFLKVGDELTDFYLVGNSLEAAAITVDASLIVVSKGDPLTSATPAGGSIAQVTNDGVFDVAATLTAPEVVAVDTSYFIEVTGTTGGGDSVSVIHAMIVLNRK